MKAIVVGHKPMEKNLAGILEEIFETVYVSYNTNDAISLIYTEPPDIIILDTSFLKDGGSRIQEFRNTAVYGHLPVIAVVEPEDITHLNWEDIPIDDFILAGDSEISIRARLPFIIKRATKNQDTNPLTRLPGNESIMRHIQRMFDQGEEIAIAWVDLDNFKPYNDHYGFARGDEVLLATARILTNTIKEMKIEPSFLGHVGGDDFIFFCPAGAVKNLCEEIIRLFDMVIRNFYNDEELVQGNIMAKDRRGKMQLFPIMSISIAVVFNRDGRYTHYGQASHDASEIKEHIKRSKGSNYMLDRRSPRESQPELHLKA